MDTYFKGESKRDDVKTVICVPFFDNPAQNRACHRSLFRKHMQRFRHCFGGCVAVIEVEQAERDRLFSRARCLNAAVMLAWKWFPNTQYIVFHDVDLLPSEAVLSVFKDPLRVWDGKGILAVNGCSRKYLDMSGYCGGVAIVSLSEVLRVNGYCNDFIGWGAEDDCFRDAVGVVVRWDHGHASTREARATCTCIEDLERRSEAGCGVPYELQSSAREELKMPRDVRRLVRAEHCDALCGGRVVKGMRELPFAVDAVYCEGDDELPHFAFKCSLFVDLSPPFRHHMSRKNGLPYFFNEHSGECSYSVPAALKIETGGSCTTILKESDVTDLTPGDTVAPGTVTVDVDTVAARTAAADVEAAVAAKTVTVDVVAAGTAAADVEAAVAAKTVTVDVVAAVATDVSRAACDSDTKEYVVDANGIAETVIVAQGLELCGSKKEATLMADNGKTQSPLRGDADADASMTKEQRREARLQRHLEREARRKAKEEKKKRKLACAATESGALQDEHATSSNTERIDKRLKL